MRVDRNESHSNSVAVLVVIIIIFSLLMVVSYVEATKLNFATVTVRGVFHVCFFSEHGLYGLAFLLSLRTRTNMC